MLHGFTIEGFRNFSGKRQWVGPLGRVNVFIGANNSGKSNLLRYIRRVVAPTLAKNASNAPLTAIDKPLNGRELNSVEILVPFEGDHAPELFKKAFSEPEIRALKAGAFDDKFLRIPYKLPPHRDQPFSEADLPLPPGSHVNTWNQLQQKFSRVSGGTIDSAYRQTWNSLATALKMDLDTIYIPAFRHYQTKLDAFADELPAAGDHEDHVIESLADLERPNWDQQQKKDLFLKLQNFMRTLLENPLVTIEIPSDRTTINVNAGDGPLPIESFGSGIQQVFLLAAEIVISHRQTILLEEPEAHLHPTLQRLLMKFIIEETTSQFFITTHSSSIIDTEGAKVFGVSVSDDGAQVQGLIEKNRRHRACRELGYRPSDLLQTNSVIWVEGPSDRVYVKAWIAAKDPKLIEDVHYSIMFYGGKLLSHLTLDDAAVEEYINILSINRSSAVIIDSDKRSSASKIRKTKLRIKEEIEKIRGFCWITDGREIENYYSYGDRAAGINKIHKDFVDLVGGRTRFSNPLEFARSGRPNKVADKIRLAHFLVENSEPVTDGRDFEGRTAELVQFIRQSNDKS